MFKIQKYLGGRGTYPDPVLIPVATGTSFKPGQAIQISDDGLGVIASGDVAAQYVSAAKLTAEDSTAGKLLLCYKVDENTVFEAPLSAHGEAVTVGAALAFDDAGEAVTATAATKGGAKIIDVNGAAAAGDLVLCTLA